MADDGVVEGGGAAEPADLEPSGSGDGRVVRTRGRLVWAGAFVGTIALIAGLIVLAGRDDKPDAKASLKAAQHVVQTSTSYRFEVHDTTHSETGDPGGAGTESTTRDLTTVNVAAADRWHVIVTPADSVDEEYGVEPSEVIRVGGDAWTRGGYSTDEDSLSPPWTATKVPDHALTVDELVEEYQQMREMMRSDGSASSDSSDATSPTTAVGSSDEATSTTLAASGDAAPTTVVASEALAEHMATSVDGIPVGDEEDPESLIDLAVAAYVLPVESDPSNIKRIILEAKDPVIEERLENGGVRLRTKLAPEPKLAKLVQQPLPPVDLILDLDGDDQPTVARFTAKVKKASRQVEIDFSGWGTAIKVDPPADGQIDHTPWVGEEDLDKLDPALRLAPTVLPGDFALTGANVYHDTYTDDAGNGDEDCPQLDLSYGTKAEADHAAEIAKLDPADVPEDDPFYENAAYLSISVSTEHCASQYYGDEDAAFDQVVGGRPARIPDIGGPDSAEDHEVDVKIDGAIVQISTSLPVAQLDALVRSLRVTTGAELAAAIPAWVASYADSYGYGGFGYSGFAPFGGPFMDL